MKIILQIILTRTPYTGNVSDNTREDDFYQLFRLYFIDLKLSCCTAKIAGLYFSYIIWYIFLKHVQ